MKREWELQKELCQQLPCGCNVSEVLNVQASRKEYSWNKLSPEDRKLWAAAAVKGWQVYIDNEAVQVLSIQRSQDIRRELAQQGRLGSILRPRFVLTDKADGLRTVDKQHRQAALCPSGGTWFPRCCKFGRQAET